MTAAVLKAVAPRPVAGHRHTSHEHEHEFEAAPGLPEPLPSGERILWQGAPDWTVLARECFHVRKLGVYFAALVVWRVVTVVASGAGMDRIAVATGMALGLAAVALGLVTLMAWLSARTALYTITNRRVVMRVGIVLSVTFNLPFSRIEAAGLQPMKGRHGDITLALDRATRIAYPHLWPHARPWHVARTQPALRCVDDAEAVARLLTGAWQAARAAQVDEAAVAAPRQVASTCDDVPSTARSRDLDRDIEMPQAA